MVGSISIVTRRSIGRAGHYRSNYYKDCWDKGNQQRLIHNSLFRRLVNFTSVYSEGAFFDTVDSPSHNRFKGHALRVKSSSVTVAGLASEEEWGKCSPLVRSCGLGRRWRWRWYKAMRRW